jgi:hypothetical protein
MVLPSPRVPRVIVVVLDGLRADAVPLTALRHVSRLASGGATSLAAQTVAPLCHRAAAMGSL